MVPRLLALLFLLLSASAQAALFTDRAAEWGLVFTYSTGRRGELYFPEIMGGGAALFDYDGDGDLDVFVVQGHPLKPGSPDPGPAGWGRLFRNDLITPQGRNPVPRFVDVTAASGIRATGYGMGAATGDFDNDGRIDLYLANFGSNQLWHNNGDGTFTDVTASGRRGRPALERRRHLRRFRPRRLARSLRRQLCRLSGRPRRPLLRPQHRAATTAAPRLSTPVPDRLLRNRGNGTFEDVSLPSGIGRKAGPGLGVVADDFDGDGWPDLFVANDGAASFLWINQKNLTFRDDGLLAGVALNAAGKPEAGMGIAAGDADGDGRDDLLITHLTAETNTFYRNLGGGLFEDATARSGLGAPSLPITGFGTGWLDFDNDGRLDLAVFNGAVNLAGATGIGIGSRSLCPAPSSTATWAAAGSRWWRSPPFRKRRCRAGPPSAISTTTATPTSWWWTPTARSACWSIGVESRPAWIGLRLVGAAIGRPRRGEKAGSPLALAAGRERRQLCLGERSAGAGGTGRGAGGDRGTGVLAGRPRRILPAASVADVHGPRPGAWERSRNERVRPRPGAGSRHLRRAPRISPAWSPPWRRRSRRCGPSALRATSDRSISPTASTMPRRTAFRAAAALRSRRSPLALPAGRRRSGRRPARGCGGSLHPRPGDGPGAAAGWVHLGEIRLLQGRPEDAEAALRKAAAIPATNAAARSLLGQAALARRDFKSAAEHLEAALAAVPAANRLHYPLALAYRGLNDRAQAEEHLARAGQVGLKAPDPLLDGVADLRLGERVALMRGRVAAQAGRYADAAQEFRKALAARPESVEARVNLGSVLASAGDRDGAAEQLREALRLDPSNVTAHFNLGSLLAGAAEARPHLEAVVAVRPEDAEARRLLAQALRDGGHLPEALEQYGQAVALAPGDETARLGEAETLVRLGRYAEARRRSGGRSEADAHQRPAEPRPGPPPRRLPGPFGARRRPRARARPGVSGRRSRPPTTPDGGAGPRRARPLPGGGGLAAHRPRTGPPAGGDGLRSRECLPALIRQVAFIPSPIFPPSCKSSVKLTGRPRLSRPSTRFFLARVLLLPVNRAVKFSKSATEMPMRNPAGPLGQPVRNSGLFYRAARRLGMVLTLLACSLTAAGCRTESEAQKEKTPLPSSSRNPAMNGARVAAQPPGGTTASG